MANPFSGTLVQIRRCLRQKRGPAATDAARPILESDNHKAIFAVARLFSDAGMTDQSVVALERCAELDSSNPVYRLVLARIFEQMGLLKEVTQEFCAALALDADNAAVMHSLAADQSRRYR